MARSLLALAIAALLLTACVPFARIARDLLDTSDGATLHYVDATDATLPGLRFDPAGAAYDALLVATGTDLIVLAVPENASCTIAADSRRMDCPLGFTDASGRRFLDEPITIHLSGGSVLANASYRRAGSNIPLVTYARDPWTP